MNGCNLSIVKINEEIGPAAIGVLKCCTRI